MDLSIVSQAIFRYANGRNIWAVKGGLGAGKTTLVKHLLASFGSSVHVSSPTFSLINEYVWEDHGQSRRVCHIDLYRLESLDEVLDIGIEEILDSEALVIIEWPDIVEELLPTNCLRIDIQEDTDGRIIVVL